MGVMMGIWIEVDSGSWLLTAVTAVLLRMAAVILIFFILFCCRMMGAGDIKLMALICGYLGLKAGFCAIACSFLLGAVWSFIRLLRLRIFRERLLYLIAYIRQIFKVQKITEYYNPLKDGYDMAIPFALCLCLGTLFYVLLTPFRA